MSIIDEITEKELASLGNKPYLVLVENQILQYQKQNVHVKIVVIKDKPVVKFGYYKKTGSELDFIELEEMKDHLENRMKNPTLAGIDFSSVAHMFQAIKVESNPVLRIINYSRSLFTTLSKSIYFSGSSTSLKAGSIELDVKAIDKLYNYFEDVYVSSYMTLLQGKILSYLRKQSNEVLKTYLSFKNFIPVLYKGKCVVNPFLESHKMNRIFLETDFFTKAKESMFMISEDNVIYLMTNKEICESLRINKYLKFYTPQLTLFLLGLFNENKFPSSKRTLTIDEEGRLLQGNVMVEGGRQVSSLYHMCSTYVKFLCPPRMLDEYISILSTASL